MFSLVEQSSDRVFVIKTTGELCIHQKVEYVRKACCPAAARDMFLPAADHITRSDEKRMKEIELCLNFLEKEKKTTKVSHW